MLIKLHDLVKKYNLKLKGILHIGAHACEEHKDYKKEGMTDDTIIWVEANPNIATRLKQLFPKRKIIQTAKKFR